MFTNTSKICFCFQRFFICGIKILSGEILSPNMVTIERFLFLHLWKYWLEIWVAELHSWKAHSDIFEVSVLRYILGRTYKSIYIMKIIPPLLVKVHCLSFLIYQRLALTKILITFQPCLIIETWAVIGYLLPVYKVYFSSTESCSGKKQWVLLTEARGKAA